MSYAPNYNPVTGEYTPRKRRLPRRRVIPTSRNKGTPLDPFSVPFSPDPVDFGETDFKPTRPKPRPRVRPVNRNAPLPPEFMPTITMPRKIDKSGRGRKRTFEPSQADARDRGTQGGSKKIGPSRPKPKALPRRRAQAVKPKTVPKRGIPRRRVIPKRR